MDQFFLDSVSLTAFMLIWLAFVLIVFFIHYIYRLCKTKKIIESFYYVGRIHIRMLYKIYIATILFIVLCVIIKSILE